MVRSIRSNAAICTAMLQNGSVGGGGCFFSPPLFDLKSMASGVICPQINNRGGVREVEKREENDKKKPSQSTKRDFTEKGFHNPSDRQCFKNFTSTNPLYLGMHRNALLPR